MLWLRSDPRGKISRNDLDEIGLSVDFFGVRFHSLISSFTVLLLEHFTIYILAFHWRLVITYTRYVDTFISHSIEVAHLFSEVGRKNTTMMTYLGTLAASTVKSIEDIILFNKERLELQAGISTSNIIAS